MQCGSGPEGDVALEDARDRLVDDLEAWAAERGVHVELDPVGFALEMKAAQMDGHLTRWRVADLDELLTEVTPRKLTADDAYQETVVPALRDLIRYLAESGRLAPGSDPAPVLDAALVRLAVPFRAAMGDRSRYGPAKALVTILQERGVDLQDADAVQRTIDQINALPYEERAALLPVPPVPDVEPAAPVVLPSEEELTAQAAATPLLARLRTVTAFYGEGRTLTGGGTPTLADARELAGLLDSPDAEVAGSARSVKRLPHVTAAVELAREARLLKLARGVLSATRRARALDDRPLTAWREAFEAVLAVGASVLSTGTQEYRYGWQDDLEGDTAGLLELLYRAGGDVPVGMLGEAFAEAAAEVGHPLGSEERLRDLVDLMMLQLLDGLELAGAVEVGPGTAETDDGEVWEGEIARLAPLGRWFVREGLLARGEPAPLAGDLAGESALRLLQAIADHPPEPAEEEIRRWIAARDPATATAELADAIRAGDDPLDRQAAAGAMTFLPDEAAGAVQALRADDLLRPYAVLWLVDRGLESPAAFDPADHPGQLVETLAAILLGADAEEVVAELQDGHLDRQALLDLPEHLRRVDSPHTDPVLAALAEAGDPALAKAVRKAQFKRRSSRPR